MKCPDTLNPENENSTERDAMNNTIYHVANGRRRKLFEMVADTKTVLMGYHFDFPAMGRIVKKGDGWSWESL